MSSKAMLIAEELLILSFQPDNGRQLVPDLRLDYALGAARLAELAVRDRIAIEQDRVVVRNSSLCGDEELDIVLERIAEHAERRKPWWWISSTMSPAARQRLLARLIDRRALAGRHTRTLWVFPTTGYVQLNPAFRQSIMERIDRVIAGADPDPPLAVLISLVRACKLDRAAFTADARIRLNEVIRNEWAGPVATRIITANSVIDKFFWLDLAGIFTVFHSG